MGKNVTDPAEYITVGKAAKRAGVTVRTLQFYDQKGLLSPSARGTRNKRFYTEKDMEKLYRILCYKYMGLSLEEIRSELKEDGGQDLSKALHHQIKEVEHVISEQIKRYAVLKDLESINANVKDGSWADMADIIAYVSRKWDMILQINQSLQNSSAATTDAYKDSEETGRYYELIADAIRLMEQGVPPEDPKAVALIKEYFDLKAMNISKGTWETKQEMIRIEPDNIRMAVNDVADFWSGIKAYLKKASDQYRKEQEEK